MIIEPDSYLQRLWAWDTNDLGELEVFYLGVSPNNSTYDT